METAALIAALLLALIGGAARFISSFHLSKLRRRNAELTSERDRLQGERKVLETALADVQKKARELGNECRSLADDLRIVEEEIEKLTDEDDHPISDSHVPED